jgi:hypothetical protein
MNKCKWGNKLLIKDGKTVEYIFTNGRWVINKSSEIDIITNLGNQMNKPFNLEEARQGKLFKLKGNIHPCHLLAVSGSGHIISENHKGIPAIVSQENLEMYESESSPPPTNQFSLTLATQGNPYTAKGTLLTLTYLAITNTGFIVGETKDGLVYTYHPSQLEMKPLEMKPLSKFVNLYIIKTDGEYGLHCSRLYDTLEKAEDSISLQNTLFYKTIEILLP